MPFRDLAVRSVRPWCVLLLAVAGLALSACGGGSGDGTPPGNDPPVTPPPPPGPPLPGVTLSPAVLTVSAATGTPGPFRSIAVTITNPPEDFYYGAWADGDAVAVADADLVTAQQGNIALTFWAPNQLGAGTYVDMVHFLVCGDPGCEDLIVEEALPVVYTVTGSPVPTTTFNVVPTTATQFEELSGDTGAKVLKLHITAFDVPPQGVYVRLLEEPAEGTPDLVTGVEFEESGYISPNGTGSGNYTVTLAAPVALGPGRYESDLVVRLCFDAACTMPVPTARDTFRVSYVVYASEGREFTMRKLDLNAAWAAWDPVREKLYVLQVFPTGDGAVTEVDPVTGTTGPSAVLPGEARMMALSDDGQFAYVASIHPQVVYRVRLADMQLEGEVTLEPMRTARMIAVAPGAPGTIAVLQTMAAANNSIAIYDGPVKRSQEALAGTSMAWNATGTELYAAGTNGSQLSRWAVTPAGLELIEDIAAPGGTGNARQMFMESGLLYFSSGTLFDPVAGTFNNWFDYCCDHLVARDPLQGRVFTTGTDVRSYSIGTGKEIATAWIPGLTGGQYFPPPLRWGSDGLAIVDYSGDLVLINGSFVAP